MMTGRQTAHQSAGYRYRFGTAIQVFYMPEVQQPIGRCSSAMHISHAQISFPSFPRSNAVPALGLNGGIPARPARRQERTNRSMLPHRTRFRRCYRKYRESGDSRVGAETFE